MNLVKLVLNIDALYDSKSTPDLEPLLEQYKELVLWHWENTRQVRDSPQGRSCADSISCQKSAYCNAWEIETRAEQIEELGDNRKGGRAYGMGQLDGASWKEGWRCETLYWSSRPEQNHQAPSLPNPDFWRCHCWFERCEIFLKAWCHLRSTGRLCSQNQLQASRPLIQFMADTVGGDIPLGSISAQDEFQRKMKEIFQGLKGLKILVDDLLIYGATREEHEQKTCGRARKS